MADAASPSNHNCSMSKNDSELEAKQMQLGPADQELYQAILAGSNETCLKILRQPNRKFSQKVFDDSLLEVCRQGNLHLVDDLLRLGADIHAKSEGGWTPVLIASKNDNTDVLKWLLTKGADVNSITAEGNSALILSIEANKSLNVTKLLLQQRGIDRNQRNHQGYTALMKAVETKNIQAMKLLIDDHKRYHLKTLATDEEGLVSDETIIHCFGQDTWNVAQTAGMVKIIKLLLRTKEDESPLMEAALRGDVELVKVFIDSELYAVQKQDCDNGNLLQNFLLEKQRRDIALSDVDIPVVQLLLENGVSVNTEYRYSQNPPVISAVESGSFGLVRLTCEYGAVLDATAKDSTKTSVHFAAESGRADILQLLLDYKASVNILQDGEEASYEDSALHLCLVNGHTDCAEILVKHGATIDIPSAAAYAIESYRPVYLKFLLERFLSPFKSFFSKNKEERYKILRKAVEKDCMETIKSLLESKVRVPKYFLGHARSVAMVQLFIRKRANVDRRTRAGKPVLMTLIQSCKNATLEIVYILLEKGANVNDINFQDFTTPLMVAAGSCKDSDLLNILILLGADVNAQDKKGNTALLHAVEHRRTGNVKFLIELEGDQDVDIEAQNWSGSNALISAVKHHYKHISDLLLDQKSINVNVEDNNANTALMWASIHGDTDTVRKMVEMGANINHQNKEGYSALMIAAQNRSHVLEFLLLRGAHVDIKDNMGNTALLYAIRNDCTTNAKLLIEHDVDKDTDFDNALISAVKQRNKIITDLLIAGGASVRAEDNNGDTALMWAVRNSDVDTVKQVIEKGADTNHQNKEGCSPLMLAARCESDDLLNILLHHGADVNTKDNKGKNALLHAVEHKRTENAQFLIGYGDGGKVDTDGQNAIESIALIAAVKNSNKTMIDLLFSRGASVSAEDSSGETALTWAARHGDIHVLERVIAKGADINHQNKEGYSALMLACRGRWKRSMEALLNAGADVNAVSKGRKKMTAISLLCGSGETPFSRKRRFLIRSVNDEFCSFLGCLLDRDASSSSLELKTLFDAIFLDKMFLVPKLVSNGLAPADELIQYELASLVEENIIINELKFSPFLFALLEGHPEVARYFDGNWFLCTSDVKLQSKYQLVRQALASRGHKECEDYFDDFVSQPMSLLKLSFVAVSSEIGCCPDREERVNQLSLPPDIKDKLLFRRQEVHLDIPELDEYHSECRWTALEKRIHDLMRWIYNY